MFEYLRSYRLILIGYPTNFEILDGENMRYCGDDGMSRWCRCECLIQLGWGAYKREI